MKQYFFSKFKASRIMKSIVVHTMLIFVCCGVSLNAESGFSGSSWLRDSEIDWSSSRSKSDIQRLAEEARNGNVKAMRRLGIISMKGIKVKPNAKIAIKWWKMAAEEGDAHSMMYLGDVYKDGNGVRKDVTRALQYYTEALKAAEEKSDAVADDNHIIIKRIKKVPLNISIDWWKERCEQGNINAMYYLGSLKESKKGNVLSDEEVSNYLIMAAKAGHSKAKTIIETAPREQYLAYWENGIDSGSVTESEKEGADRPVKRETQSSPKLSKLKLSKSKELMEAVGNGKYWLFEDLIKEGADLNYIDKKEGLSAFARASSISAQNGDMEGLKILLRYNPNIYHCSEHFGSAFNAVMRGPGPYWEQVINLLLDAVNYSELPKGSLSALCADGNSPMHMCSVSGFASCVEKMLINGVSADDSKKGLGTPLYEMICLIGSNAQIHNPDGFIQCFKMLLQKADLNRITVEDLGNKKRFVTPLTVALEYHLFSVATTLIEAGADVNLCLNGQTNALGYFIRSSFVMDEGSDPIIEFLVENGASVENDPDAKKLLRNYEKAWYFYQKKHPQKTATPR